MNNREILTKAIEKAVANGWDNENLMPWRDGYGTQKLKSMKHLKEYDVEHVIFDHDFAKALWGEPSTRYAVFPDAEGAYGKYPKHGWQYHLQEMVIADDPIKYLGEHL